MKRSKFPSGRVKPSTAAFIKAAKRWMMVRQQGTPSILMNGSLKGSRISRMLLEPNPYNVKYISPREYAELKKVIKMGRGSAANIRFQLEFVKAHEALKDIWLTPENINMGFTDMKFA